MAAEVGREMAGEGGNQYIALYTYMKENYG
jgi:hypothetical protein